MELEKTTSLAKVDTSVSDVLNWKLEEIRNKNLPIEQGLADYISLSVNSIDEKIKQLDSYKNDIVKAIGEMKAHKDNVSTECAEWLNNQGIDKLNGFSCSSITITKEKEAEEVKVIEKVLILDESQETINDFLVEEGYAHYETKE